MKSKLTIAEKFSQPHENHKPLVNNKVIPFIEKKKKKQSGTLLD